MTPKKHAARHARLFGEPDPPANVYVAYVDGAARGNPGPASYAVILYRPDGHRVFQLGKYLGRATNNVAEYYGLLAALDYVVTQRIIRLRVRSDSELLVRQMRGQYRVKSAVLKPLHERARKLADSLNYFAIEHVPREQNAEADRLANEALDHPGSSVGAQHDSPADAAAKRGANRKRIRARYRDGALHPAEPLDLPEGEDVEITIHSPLMRKPRGA